METLFRIGEVAEMFDSSIRALRLYDKMGLFVPRQVDAETGYRSYTADQLPMLNTILVLKGIGFRLVEIRDLVTHGMQADLLLDALDRKKESLENDMEIARFKLENVARIREAVMVHQQESPTATEDGESGDNAYKMSRLVCLENLKVDHILSEVLWL